MPITVLARQPEGAMFFFFHFSFLAVTKMVFELDYIVQGGEPQLHTRRMW